MGAATTRRFDDPTSCGILLQYPATDGAIVRLRAHRRAAARARRAFSSSSPRISLALTLLAPPGEFGADVAVGILPAVRRPHGLRRPARRLHGDPRRTTSARCPGASSASPWTRTGARRCVWRSQTREQHIRREKATSNICTAQVLLAIMAGMYAVYHGPDGLRAIASRVHRATGRAGGRVAPRSEPRSTGVVLRHPACHARRRGFGERAGQGAGPGVNLPRLRRRHAGHLSRRDRARRRRSSWSCAPSRATPTDLPDIAQLSAAEESRPPRPRPPVGLPHPRGLSSLPLRARDAALHQRLRQRDLSLTPLDDPAGLLHDEAERHDRDDPGDLAGVRRSAPLRPGGSDARATRAIFDELETWLAEITGFDAMSLQPNAGSQGEYAGLLAIRAYHADRGRDRPRRLPDPDLGPRHQPGERRDGGHAGRRGRVRRPRQHRRRRPAAPRRRSTPSTSAR